MNIVIINLIIMMLITIIVTLVLGILDIFDKRHVKYGKMYVSDSKVMISFGGLTEYEITNSKEIRLKVIKTDHIPDIPDEESE